MPDPESEKQKLIAGMLLRPVLHLCFLPAPLLFLRPPTCLSLLQKNISAMNLLASDFRCEKGSGLGVFGDPFFFLVNYPVKRRCSFRPNVIGDGIFHCQIIQIISELVYVIADIEAGVVHRIHTCLFSTVRRRLVFYFFSLRRMHAVACRIIPSVVRL